VSWWATFGSSLPFLEGLADHVRHIQVHRRGGNDESRDPRSIQVVAFFAPPDPEALQALEDAGANAALIALETAGEQEALAKLEEIAQKVLP